MPDVRLGKHEDAIPQYKVFRITALTTATPVPIGLAVNTTIAAAITAGNSVTITPLAMTNITKGKRLSIVNGATWENITVLSVTGTTFVANFANSYGTASNLYSVDGAVLGPVVVNSPGATVVLTLYNGLPGMLPKAGAIIAAITPVAGSTLGYAAIIDQGLFMTYLGTTAGEVVVHYLDHPPQF